MSESRRAVRGASSRICLGVLAAGVLAACSGVKTYPDTRPKNLRVYTAVSAVRAALDVHRVGTTCEAEYQGTVQLDSPSLEIGLPAEGLSYVVFRFYSSSFLTGSSRSLSYGTLIRPRAGYTYEAKVSYKDDIYNVSIREIDVRKSSSREIERRDLSACKAA